MDPAPRLLSFRVRRWLVLLMLSVAVQWLAVVIAPQFITGCGLGVEYPMTLAIPLLWSSALIALYRNPAEQAIGWMGFIHATFVFLMMNRWACS